MTVWAIRCGTLFDGTGAAPLRDAGIIVADGRITAVGRADATAAPPGARTLDLSNRFVMPGLINCHSHASIVPGLGDQLGQLCRGPVPQALAATRNLRQDLAAGTTTMRIMGEEHLSISRCARPSRPSSSPGRACSSPAAGSPPTTATAERSSATTVWTRSVAALARTSAVAPTT